MCTYTYHLCIPKCVYSINTYIHIQIYICIYIFECIFINTYRYICIDVYGIDQDNGQDNPCIPFIIGLRTMHRVKVSKAVKSSRFFWVFELIRTCQARTSARLRSTARSLNETIFSRPRERNCFNSLDKKISFRCSVGKTYSSLKRNLSWRTMISLRTMLWH